MKYRLVIFGSSSFGIPAFETLRRSKLFDIVTVVSQPDRPVGRRAEIESTAVSQWAAEHHIPLLTPPSLRKNADSVIDQLRQCQADIFLVAAYGLIVPATLLDLPRAGCLNIHGSILPALRGASPIQAAILSG